MYTIHKCADSEESPEDRTETFESPAPGTSAAGWPYAADTDLAAALRDPLMHGL